MRKKPDYRKLMIALIIVCVITISIGFSAAQDNLTINRMTAMVRVPKEISITNLSFIGSNSGGTSSNEYYSSNNLISTISLPNADSTITYDIDITNAGQNIKGINAVIDLPNNLTYTFENYNLGAALCDDEDNTKCTLNATRTVKMTIGYAENAYDSSNTNFNLELNFEFYNVTNVARIGNTEYSSLVSAISAVPASGPPTTVILLKNTAERANIASGKNVIMDMPGLVISNSGTNPVFELTAASSLTMSNGTIFTNTTQGAVNVKENSNFTMTGGKIISTGNKQALYVEKGTASISGDSYLSAKAEFAKDNNRSTVHVLANGSLDITGGTIVSIGGSGCALDNLGTTTIGTKDGNISTTTPLIQGTKYGIYLQSGTFNFYDGIAKGVTAHIYNRDTKLTDYDDTIGYSFYDGTEEINGETYRVTYLTHAFTVTFDPGTNGEVDRPIRTVHAGAKLGELPIPTRSGYVFGEWLDENNQPIDETYTVTRDVTFTATWTKTNQVAQIDNTVYDTLAEAINAVPNNSQRTITLLKDASETVTVPAQKNIIFDFGAYTLSNSGTNPIVTNKGTLAIVSGTIQSNADFATINNEGGTLLISGGNIIATGTRQSVYISNGSVTITGTAYLSSTASGLAPSSKIERAAVQCTKDCTLVVTGGTIIGINSQAISNEGTVTIGTQGGGISTTSPVLQGATYGIKSVGTFNYYDGIIKGTSNPIEGTIDNQEADTHTLSGSEVIDNVTYNTVVLEED